MPAIRDRYDALVIGGGIAGMQAALDLSEQGYEVLLVEQVKAREGAAADGHRPGLGIGDWGFGTRDSGFGIRDSRA